MAVKKTGYVYSGPGYASDLASGKVELNTGKKDYQDYAKYVSGGSGSSGGSSGSGSKSSNNDIDWDNIPIYNDLDGDMSGYDASFYDVANKLGAFGMSSPDDDVPAYESKYAGQINDILQKIQNKGSFDINNDANYKQLYDQYKQRYQESADMAMRDTLGNANLLSGGYGSTYAQKVAQQAYDQTMAGLNDRNDELYQLAYGMFLNDQSDLYNQLGALQGLDNAEYARYRDEVNDYYNALANFYNRQDIAYERDQADQKQLWDIAETYASQGIEIPETLAARINDSDMVALLNTLAANAQRKKLSGGPTPEPEGEPMSKYDVDNSFVLRMLQGGENKEDVAQFIKYARSNNKAMYGSGSDAYKRAEAQLKEYEKRNMSR